MHQIRFRLGLCPRPHWGSLRTALPRLLSCDALLLIGGKDEREGKGGEGRGKECVTPPPGTVETCNSETVLGRPVLTQVDNF